MTTRREMLCAVLISLSTVFAIALPEKAAPLEVTYYFLPG
jgi:hypothetical protein